MFMLFVYDFEFWSAVLDQYKSKYNRARTMLKLTKLPVSSRNNFIFFCIYMEKAQSEEVDF